MSKSNPFSNILAADIDGRTQSIRYRQSQLRKLHDTLIANSSEARNAIIKDSNHTYAEAEADIEFCLAILELKRHYTSLNLKQSLDEEYRVAKGQDAPERRVGSGVVCISPTSHTLFYSVISPLSAAIAAGNCVVIELPNTLLAVASLLRSWLRDALDRDAFLVCESVKESPEVLNRCIRVFQNGTEDHISPLVVALTSLPEARSVAIVDRTADLEKAAAALVTARFSFGGRSPYAPDLVLVNEFVMTDFLDAVVQKSTRYLAAQQNGAAAEEYPIARRDNSIRDLVDKAHKEQGVRVVVSGANGTVLEVKNRESSLLMGKVTGPLLTVHPIRSLDDAINVAASTAGSETLLSSLIFAGLGESKYLSQFIPAHMSCINRMPIELLVGPGAPQNSRAQIFPRYEPEMFTAARPQYLSAPNQYSDLLAQGLGSKTRKELPELREKALEQLPPTGQKEGRSIGFFEQGIITGGLVFILPTLGTFAAVGFYGVRKLLRLSGWL